MKGPVVFDRETGTIVLNLPEEGKEHGDRLIQYLHESFAFEAISNSVLHEMNKEARSWLASQGIQVKWDLDGRIDNGA